MPARPIVFSGTATNSPLGAPGSFTLLSVACLTIMVGCVIVPGLPSIAPALGVGNAAAWLVTIPSLGVVLFGPAAGWLIDRVGAYRSLCVGLVLYGVFGLAAVLLRGMVPVFADRLALGGATAIVMASGTMLISSFFTGQERLAMIARQGMTIELGGVIFLSIGGYLTSFGWTPPFALYGIAFLFLIMVLAFVPSNASTGVTDETDPSDAAPASNGAVLIAAFCSMIVFFAAIVILPFSLSERAGLTEAQTGYFLSGVSLVAVCFAGSMPRLAARFGDRGTLIAAFLCYGVAHCLFAAAQSLPAFLAGGTLLGAGFGLSVPLANHMTIERSPKALRGRRLAHLSMAIFLGQFLASPLQYVPGGQNAGFACAALIAFVAALFGLTKHAR